MGELGQGVILEDYGSDIQCEYDLPCLSRSDVFNISYPMLSIIINIPNLSLDHSLNVDISNIVQYQFSLTKLVI